MTTVQASEVTSRLTETRGKRVTLFTFAAATLAFPMLWLAFGSEFDAWVRATALMFGIALVARWIPWRRDTAIVLALIFPVFLVLAHFWQQSTVPEDIFGGSQAIRYWRGFFFFVPLAYASFVWRKSSPFVILYAAAAGLFAHLIFHAPFVDWAHAWAGMRVAYGFPNAQHAGVVFGAGLLCVVFFSHRVRCLSTSLPRALAVVAMLALGALMFWGVITTQVRAVWLGLLVSSAAAIVLFACHGRSQLWAARRRLVPAILVFAALLAFGLTLGGYERIALRLASEQISVETLSAAAQHESNELSSSAVRVASWSASLDWIAERPFLGWGAFTAKGLIRGDDRFDEDFKGRYGHLHNSYLEVLVASGLVGAGLLVGLCVWVGRQTVLARQVGIMPLDVFVFAWAFFAFWCVVNVFESYAYMRIGFYIHTVIGGFVYAFCLPLIHPDKTIQVSPRC